ncbi:hypothetical protein ACFW0H_15000 [Pseudomonas sp. CR3202]|uniref:hypothetical protein n=1 Tax=Pseudomonas sp. CR3202 TaxID=3351532 RepID=UPI003BF01841
MKPYGKLPRRGYPARPAPRKKTPVGPKCVVKIKGEMHPGELAVTLQRAAEELAANGLVKASKVSLYLTPLDAEGKPVPLVNPQGAVCEELSIEVYLFVDKELMV